MKKRFLLILSVIACLLILVACQGAGSSAETETATGSSQNSNPDKDNNIDDNPDDDYDVIEGDNHTHTAGELIAVVEPTFEAGGYSEYTCSECGSSFKKDYTNPLKHSFSEEWSFNADQHWNACTDEGYASVTANSEAHTFTDEIITDSTPDATGILKSTCSVCSYTFESVIPRKNHIVSLPSVDESKCFVGMPLSMITLSGGEASVSGSFAWSDPDIRIGESGSYDVVFTPSDPEFAKINATVSISASWLTVNLSVGSNGEASVVGGSKIRYGEDATVNLIPRFGYEVDSLVVDGSKKESATSYTLQNVTSNKNVSVSFKTSSNPVSVNCISGSNGCYSISGGTLTISGISSDTVYSISGEAFGNIVIDVSSDYKFELELAGFKLTSVNAAPITILNGDKVTISAKKSFTNYIYDLRPAVSGNTPATYPAAIYSLIDLDIEGKGSLTVSSANNGGIYTKKDVELKNLTLSVTASENALRGNDSVTIESCNTTIIATRGDAVKTTNSDISSKGNQRGNVTITGGVHNIYAAGDGISAAHNVVITDSTTVLNIYTDSYSEYTLLKTDVSNEKIYLRADTSQYTYSVRYSSKDGKTEWADAAYVGEFFIGGETVYLYEATKKVGYTSIAVFAYTSEQTQGQDISYHLTTNNIPTNRGFDTIAIKELESSLGFRYTSFYLTENGSVTVDERSNRGIKAANSITISAGTISISSHGDAIKANNDAVLENGNTPTGDITISGGNITVSTYSTAVLAEGDVSVTGGTVTVNSSFIGLSGDTVSTSGSTVSIVAVYKPTNAKK